MARGGARPNSGPAKNPASARTAKAGIQFTEVSAKPYRGKIPEFPLPEGKVTFKVGGASIVDAEATKAFRARELELWTEAWRTYAAAHVWAKETWRLGAVADWVRLSVRCEALDASASLIAQKTDYGHEALVTLHGLHSAGYAIEKVTPAPRRSPAKTKKPAPRSRTRKLKLVTDDDSST